MDCLVLTCLNPFFDRKTRLYIGEIVVRLLCLSLRFVMMLESSEFQVLVSEGYGYGGMERFLLQPIKSIVMPITGKAKKTTESEQFT